MKLTIELVPKTSWYSNVRSKVSKTEWDIIRKKSYKNAGYKCEICGDIGQNQGVSYPVECHEIWEYNDVNKKQILKGLISLCPYCHKTKHIGLAQINNEIDIVINQLIKVNNMTSSQAEEYIENAFDIWRKRNKNNYTLDISFLDNY
jgi:hypothetical protein